MDNTVINLFYLYAEHKGVKIINAQYVKKGVLIELSQDISHLKYREFISGIQAKNKTVYKDGKIMVMVYTIY